MASNNGNGVLWAAELAQKYTSGIAHQFVLHFNVADYTQGLASVSEYLQAMLGARDLVISYDIAGGIQFHNPAHRKLFIKALGLDAPAGGDLAAAMGLQTVQTPQSSEVTLPRKPEEALPLLERALHLQEVTNEAGESIYPRVAVIIHWAEQLAPAGEAGMMSPADRQAVVTLARWASDHRIRASNGIVILVCRNLQDLAEPLRSSTAMIEAITVPLPDEAARLAWIQAYLVEKPEVELAMPVEILARATAGLSLVHIEDIFLRAQHEGRPVDRSLVKDRKDQIISQEFGDVLEILDPQFGLDMIAGHAAVKAYFQDYVINALRAGDTARAPLGVLLMGPPGTGKTAIVEAVAFECGFNAVNLNLAKILAGLVGASERNLEKALLAIEALSPAIVFTDEIDQKMGQRGGYQGDSGVSARLFGRVMEFMSDTAHRGHIVWLAATNRPDLLDAAFKRPGRFDAKVPMLLPVKDIERVELFRVMFRKYGLVCKATETNLRQAAKATDGYSGADIESVVIKANQVAGRDGQAAGEVCAKHLLYAIKCIAPSAQGVEFMTSLALAEVSDLEFVPEQFKGQAADKVALHKEIEATTPRTGNRGAREL